MIKAKLIKLEDIRPDHEKLKSPKIGILRLNIITSYDGYFNDWPVLGKTFTFIPWAAEKEAVGVDVDMYPIYTTDVIEILDNNVFKTKNSMYKILTIEEERDSKIEKILN